MVEFLLANNAEIDARDKDRYMKLNRGDQMRQINWYLDSSVSGSFGAGIGAATKAAGLSGSATIVRSPLSFSALPERCFGITTIGSALWWQSPDHGVSATEYLLLAGPRWDSHDDEATVFYHTIAGVRRITMTASGMKPTVETSLAFGAGFGLQIGSIRFPEINYVFSPGSSISKHQFTISFGMAFSKKLNRYP